MPGRTASHTLEAPGFTPDTVPPYGLYRQRRRIILCFDGTGNKFSGTSADSNILKIYGMLDHDNGDKHYYQPGIGTYVNTRSISHTSRLARLNSWYQKAKDSAVGTSFDEHVMGAYKFLMQCYEDDDIFIFGFSRGAYLARFLAEMLDHVGLLSAGNQEMARFAWKAFAQWQEREDNTAEGKVKKKELLHFLQSFRNTFSRPVRRIRFLGLFDTVNSVPRFENAWMKRSKFPYTARSKARVIRHAVSIDERRAKFRSDLLSEAKPARLYEQSLQQKRGRKPGPNDDWMTEGGKAKLEDTDRFRRKSRMHIPVAEGTSAVRQKQDYLDPRRSTQAGIRTPSPAISRTGDADASSIQSGTSMLSTHPGYLDDNDDDEDEAAAQDIEELWFPGCHADLGGGWPLDKMAGEEAPLSHGPLVWMVREAQRAGLEFDPEKLLEYQCCDENYEIPSLGLPANGQSPPNKPDIRITSPSSAENTPDIFNSPRHEQLEPGWAPGLEPEQPAPSTFHRFLNDAFTKGVLHDCLEFKNGLGASSVVSWKMMEYLPFRRMDLRSDGSWKAISLPLPMGETRDLPKDARIHHSAIRRMEANENYRPGNLIIGGGGRGARRAPKELGIGQWEVFKEDGDMVGMTYIRKRPNLERQRDKEEFGSTDKKAKPKNEVEVHPGKATEGK